jgi:hypothetical protein
MLKLNEEYFDNKYYFLLREKKDGGHLWFAVSNTLTEARKKDAYIKVPKEMIKKIQKHLDKLIKSKKGNTTKELNSELEEIVNSDGVMQSSRIPILDPRLHPKKTMDQTVVSTTQPGDFLARSIRSAGGRTYMGEEDLSKAFGYEETKDLPPKKTVKKLKDMGVENAIERAKEFGKDPSLNQDLKEPDSEMRIRITEKEKIQEIQKRKMEKLVRNIMKNL